MMKISKKILPGQPGTKALLKKYGDKLICIRYRYDYATRKKYKSVELIVSERDWHPEGKKIPMNKRIYLRINYSELELRQKIKANGGIWDVEKKLWYLPYKKVMELGLEPRIVKEA